MSFESRCYPPSVFPWPRSAACSALRNSCLVKVPASQPRQEGSAAQDSGANQPQESQEAQAGQAIINLDEYFLGLSATALAEHPLWASTSSVFADLRVMIEKNRKAVSVFSGIIRFVFLKQPAFSHVLSDKDDKVSPETLQVWKDSANEKLKDWVGDANICKDVESCLIKPWLWS